MALSEKNFEFWFLSKALISKSKSRRNCPSLLIVSKKKNCPSKFYWGIAIHSKSLTAKLQVFPTTDTCRQSNCWSCWSSSYMIKVFKNWWTPPRWYWHIGLRNWRYERVIFSTCSKSFQSRFLWDTRLISIASLADWNWGVTLKPCYTVHDSVKDSRGSLQICRKAFDFIDIKISRHCLSGNWSN